MEIKSELKRSYLGMGLAALVILSGMLLVAFGRLDVEALTRLVGLALGANAAEGAAYSIGRSMKKAAEAKIE